MSGQWADGDGTSGFWADGGCRARIYKMSTGFWMGEVFHNHTCAGHSLTEVAAKAACEALWLKVRDEVAAREACPQGFDVELPGDYPRVYCRFGCGCWVYAYPAPGHPGCGTLCNQHPSVACETFICALLKCRSNRELHKAMAGLPSEIERLPERTPEENARLFKMLDEVDEAEKKS